MTRHIFFTVLAIFALAIPAAAQEPLRLTILVTNDVHGYVEPCG